ncbi:hypothetical protein BT93_E1882 [Corymbia citriodora subsp. variegata]|nr:hypothetical protein BT93_E1882 [Corymbia citriodora subsp. variegata]
MRTLLQQEETRVMRHKIHAEMEALDGLLEQWQRTGFLAMEVTEKLSACSFM